MENHNTTTPDDEKDLAQTPKWFIRALEQHLGLMFVRDVCALQATKKCTNYYSLTERGENALELSWSPTNFCNPPFSDIVPWAQKAAVESQKGCITAMLIPDKPEVKYVRFCREFADTLIHMPFRLKFLRPDGSDFLDKKGRKQGPKFPVVVALFTPWGLRMPCRDVYFDFRTLRRLK